MPAAREVTQAEATVQTDDGPMPVHVALPAGEPKGGVVVVHEAFGVTAHIRDVARRFAAAGWHALAPTLFHRKGSPVLPYGEIDQAQRAVQTLTAKGITNDLSASFASIERSGIPAGRSAVVGFCMGGTIAFYAATLRPMGAAVSFYGGGVVHGRFGLPAAVDLVGSLATPWLGLYGEDDPSIPLADLERLEAATTADAPVETEIVRYPGAGHGFHCDARPDSYAPDAAQDAWHRTLGWLERHAGAHAALG